MRPEHPLLLLNYVEGDGAVQNSYRLPGRFARVANNGSYFRIQELRRKKKHIELEVTLAENNATRLKLYLFDNDKVSDVFQIEGARLMLNDLFLFGESPYEFPSTGNLDSDRLHLAACNHLPSADRRRQFQSIEQGEAAGFSRCKACFADTRPLPISGYTQLRRSAMKGARLHEIIYPPIEDAALQNQERSIHGTDLLVWPL